MRSAGYTNETLYLKKTPTLIGWGSRYTSEYGKTTNALIILIVQWFWEATVCLCRRSRPADPFTGSGVKCGAVYELYPELCLDETGRRHSTVRSWSWQRFLPGRQTNERMNRTGTTCTPRQQRASIYIMFHLVFIFCRETPEGRSCF